MQESRNVEPKDVVYNVQEKVESWVLKVKNYHTEDFAHFKNKRANIIYTCRIYKGCI